MIVALMLGLYWLGFFCSGFSGGNGLSESRKTIMLGKIFFIAGLTLYFYQLVIGNIGLLADISSREIGIIVLFLGSSLGTGYLTGKYQRMQKN